MPDISRVPYSARTAAVFTEVLRINRSSPKEASEWNDLVAQADGLEHCLRLLIRETKMLDYENHALRERLAQAGITLEFAWPHRESEEDLVSRSIAYLGRR